MSEQASFNDWAIVEMFGHQQIAGHVTTEYFGTACMFRVDVPALPEREIEVRRDQVIGDAFCRAGSKVKRPAEPGYSRLLGPGAIYALNPCTEETVREFIESNRKLPLIPLDLPGARAKALAAPVEDDDSDEDDDDPDFHDQEIEDAL